MEHTLNAISEMRDFFDRKVTSMDIKASEADNGQKDYKSAYRKTMLEIIDDTIEDLQEMKKNL